MEKQYKKLLKISVWASIVLFAVRCGLSWQAIITGASLYDLFSYAGEAIGVGAVCTALYERVFWRINPFDKTPRLHKKYSGTLKSSYDSQERSAQLETKQTLLSVHIVLISNESKSKSISASIDDILNEPRLTYCYLNTPKSEFRYRSEIHFGTATLSLADPSKLTGQYYTDRKTTGDMIFTATEN